MLWLQHSLFTFMTPVVNGIHHNSFWINYLWYSKELLLRILPELLFDTSSHSARGRCSVKKMLLQIFQNSQKNTCSCSLFYNKVFFFFKKKGTHRFFPRNFAKFVAKNTFSIEHSIIFITMKVNLGVPLLELSERIIF